MVNMDYPGPCPSCGSVEECEHRKLEAKAQGADSRDFESDVGSEVQRESSDPHDLSEEEKEIDK